MGLDVGAQLSLFSLASMCLHIHPMDSFTLTCKNVGKKKN
jgi:hypothetical protein